MDPFAGALTDESQLRELYEPPAERAWRKDIGRLDARARELIALSPMVFVGSADADGRCDVTPRGGPPGFVTVLDDDHLAIPDATGNRRLDTLGNVVSTGRAGLLFVIPGRDTTLRVNGRACVSAQTALLDRLSPVGKPPRTAIVVAVEEVYTHCPKSFVRSALWDTASWASPEEQPSPAQVVVDHLGDPDYTVADEERYQAESLRDRLA